MGENFPQLRRAPGPAGRRIIGTKIALLLLVVLLALAGFVGYSEQRYAKLTERLEAHVATYERFRWDRPVLRGKPRDGNAAADVRAVLADIPQLTDEQRSTLAEQLHFGQPLTAELQALIGDQAANLAKLRAATRNSWAKTTIDVTRLQEAPVPDYPRFIDAVLLSLGEARQEDGDDCLQTCVDLIRMGQDLVPGAPLEATSVAMRTASLVSRVLPRCARRAEDSALIGTARELHTLAEHPPPSGSGIEVADIMAMIRLQRLADLFHEGGEGSVLDRLRRRPAIYEAWRHFDEPTRWRELAPTNYPEMLETWRREQEWRSRSELMMVGDATAGVLGWLYDDMRGQALIRVMTLGMATLAERARHDKLPHEPPGLDDAVLRDPFNGQALKWRVSQGGSELSVWSVGEDRRDDKGSSEWAMQAPLDVVVHFPLQSGEAAANRRARRRR
ncbi:MAG: hypothetical protein PVI30_14190 [Myxococcales bacterium]|jgi:hypothetical protein